MEDEKWKIKLINEAFKNEEKAIETLKQQYEKNSIKNFINIEKAMSRI